MNPLIPSLTDFLMAAVVVVNLILVVAALVALARAADKRHWVTRLLLILLVPIVGPIVSLVTTGWPRPVPD